MVSTSTATNDLEALITRLEAERQEHVDAIAAIDELFARFGIRARGLAGKRRGRKVGKNGAAKKAGKSSGHNPKFLVWADTVASWPALAKKVGISYPTALGLRDGRVPRAKVRAKIAKASGGAVPVDSW